MTPRNRRWTQIGLGLAIAFVLFLALRPKPIEVDVAIVDRGSLAVTVDEEGETRVRDRFVVSAPVAGTVLRIELEPGDPIVAGETVVATFERAAPPPHDARTEAQMRATVKAAEAAVGRSRAERARVHAELEHAKLERERIDRLMNEAIVSRDQLDRAQLAVDTAGEGLHAAEFQVANALQELEAARAALIQGEVGPDGKPFPLRAPISGVVLKRLRESEAVVPSGEPLLELGDPNRLEIVSDLLSQDAVKVEAGDPVLIEQWGGATTLRAKVRRVEPSGFTKISALGVEEQRVNVVIDFDDPLEAWKQLGDGYRVEVRIVVWQSEDVVKAPTSSLFRDGEAWAVFTLEDGKAVTRRVELGHRNGLEAEIVSGLDAGTTVIVHPSDDVKGGVAVAVREI